VAHCNIIGTLCRELCKMAEPNKMPFRIWTRVGPRNHVLDGVQIPMRKGAILRAQRGWPGHLWRLINSVTQQGAELVWCRYLLGVLDGVHTGATLQIWLNRPCAAVMWPSVKLLQPLVSDSVQPSAKIQNFSHHLHIIHPHLLVFIPSFETTGSLGHANTKLQSIKCQQKINKTRAYWSSASMYSNISRNNWRCTL